MAGGDDLVGIGHDGPVVKEDVDMVLRGQQGADVAFSTKYGWRVRLMVSVTSGSAA